MVRIRIARKRRVRAGARIMRPPPPFREAEEREDVEIKKAALIKKVEDQRRWRDFIASLKGKKGSQGRG